MMRVSEKTRDTPLTKTKSGKIRSYAAKPAQSLCSSWSDISGHGPAGHVFAITCTSASAPRIQNMSNPRSASSETRREPAPEGVVTGDSIRGAEEMDADAEALMGERG